MGIVKILKHREFSTNVPWNYFVMWIFVDGICDSYILLTMLERAWASN